jgi:hypothetical protein
MAIFDNIGGLLGDLSDYGIGVPRNTGLISDTADIDAINKRALMSGIINAGLTYAGTPKNLGAGNPIPYLARAAASGFGASQNVIDQALNTAFRNRMLSARNDEFSSINPLDVTPESLKLYQESIAQGKKDPSLLRRVAPVEKPKGPIIVAPGSTVYDPESNTAQFTAPDKSKGFTDSFANASNILFQTTNPSDLTSEQRKQVAEFAKQLDQSKSPKNVINMPNPNKAILDVDKDTLTGLVASTNSARSIANQTRTINSLIGNQQGSGAIKLTSDLQNFLGINTPTANVNQAVQAIATKAATEIRTPGSGSTSDLEFGAYRSAFPSLATSKPGREIMVKIAEANAARNAKLSDWARKNIQEGTFSYEGLAAYDNSLGQAVSNDVKKKVDELIGNPQNRGGANNPNQGLFNQADQILNRTKTQ